MSTAEKFSITDQTKSFIDELAKSLVLHDHSLKQASVTNKLVNKGGKSLFVLDDSLKQGSVTKEIVVNGAKSISKYPSFKVTKEVYTQCCCNFRV